jgi:hypothetical protein
MSVDKSVLSDIEVLQVDTEDPLLEYAAYILIAMGAFVFLVGFLGCCGAIKESKCMLGLYIFFLVLVMAGELAAGIIAIIYKDKVWTVAGLEITFSLPVAITRTWWHNEYKINLKCVLLVAKVNFSVAFAKIATLFVLFSSVSLYRCVLQILATAEDALVTKLQEDVIYTVGTDNKLTYTAFGLTISAAQVDLQCCGINGTENYASSAFEKVREGAGAGAELVRGGQGQGQRGSRENV